MPTLICQPKLKIESDADIVKKLYKDWLHNMQCLFVLYETV